MGDYLRLLTVNDRDIPLATLQRAVPNVAIWSVDHPGILGNYLAIGGELGVLQNVWATIERNPVGPNTLGAEEVAEFIDSLDAGGPSSAVRWLERIPGNDPRDLRDSHLSRGHRRPSPKPKTPSTPSARPCATPSAESASGTAMGSPTKTTA